MRREIKKALEAIAPELLKRLKGCRIIGLGSGRTVAYLLKHVSDFIKKEEMEAIFVPSSRQIALRAEELRLELKSHEFIESIDFTVDGADEVDLKANAIKGGGGALINERILASMSKKYVIVVDEEKLSSRVGEKASVPVELIPRAYKALSKILREKNLEFKLRVDERGYPKLSESGNLVFNVKMPMNVNLRNFYTELKLLPGVVDVGIFLSSEIDEVIIGKFDGTFKRLRGGRS